MKKYLAALLAVLCLAAAVYADGTADALQKDFICSPWAESYVQKADELGLIPVILQEADLTKPITRKEFAALSVSLCESVSGIKAEASDGVSFTDCTDEEVLKAASLGITDGFGNGLFLPEALLTREQAATMLTRVYKKTTFDGWTLESDADFERDFVMGFTPSLLDFDDRAAFSNWAYNSIKFMRARNIIDGKGNNVFDSKGNATREQALKIAVKMVTVMTDPDFAPPAARLVDVQSDMALYTWDEEEKSIIALYNTDGKAVQRFELSVSGRPYPQDSPLLMLTKYNGWYAGHAGLWRIENAELKQISAIPAKDLAFVRQGPASSAPIILTWTEYENLDSVYRPADSIVSLEETGPVFLLNSADGHGIDIAGLRTNDSVIEFYSEIPQGMGHYDSYLYALLSAVGGVPQTGAGPAITVVSFSAGRPEVMDGFSFEAPESYRTEYVQREQQRLNELGIGFK